MSVFKGELYEPELKYVCVDYFWKPKSRDASTFFLSHCHTDHMKGLLYNDDYINDLFGNSPKAKLYCSPITALFVGNHPKIRIPKDRVERLELGKAVTITVWPNEQDSGSVEPYQLDVTLFPAGHCPGSVMFLFELPSLRVLFTGDFRADVNQISAMKGLHFSDNHLKEIDVIYLDNTFDEPRYEAFPSRKESLQSLIDIIEDWISFRKDRLIKLRTSARFGSEFLFENLGKRYGKVHVDIDEYLNFYQHIPQLKEAVTPNETESGPIHSCFNFSTRCCCRLVNKVPSAVREIKPCALAFQSSVLAKVENVIRDRSREFFRVIYSCHSSHSEIKGILNYLKPKKVHCITSTKSVTSEPHNYAAEDSDFDEEYCSEPAIKKTKNESEHSGTIKLRLFQPVRPADDLSFSSDMDDPSSPEFLQSSQGSQSSLS